MLRLLAFGSTVRFVGLGTYLRAKISLGLRMRGGCTGEPFQIQRSYH